MAGKSRNTGVQGIEQVAQMTEWQHLLLLPGLLCDDRLWQPQVDALSEIAEIVIADMTRDDTLAGMAARPLDAMPGHFALAGLSMGGYAAFEIMRQAPERVTRLALLDTGARADTPEQTTGRKDLIALADRGGDSRPSAHACCHCSFMKAG